MAVEKWTPEEFAAKQAQHAQLQKLIDEKTLAYNQMNERNPSRTALGEEIAILETQKGQLPE